MAHPNSGQHDGQQQQRSVSPGQRGRIHKGPPPVKAVPDNQKPVSSIPAKFETVLFSGPKEKKGFLSTIQRFVPQEDDMPGPGTYIAAAVPSMEFKHDSISKKGYGPMASKAKRFKGRRVAYTGPGPGEYNSKLVPPALDFNKVPATSAFRSKEHMSHRKAEGEVEDPVPGPGAYTVTETRTGQKLDYLSKQGHTSAFKARSHQLILAGSLDTPAPTAYTVADPWDDSRSVRSRSPSKATASFAQPASMGSLGGPASLPTLLYGPGAPDAKPDTGPGPGAYEMQYFASIKTTLSKVAGKTSAPFQQPEFADRFGRPLRPRTEEEERRLPVDYFAPLAPVRKLSSPAKGVGAPFVSKSAGHTEANDIAERDAPPGPAYYRPVLPIDRKSFHLNVRQRFVASS